MFKTKRFKVILTSMLFFAVLIEGIWISVAAAPGYLPVIIAATWTPTGTLTPSITPTPTWTFVTDVRNPPTPDQTQVPLKALATQVIAGINVSNPPTPDQTIGPWKVMATEVALLKNIFVNATPTPNILAWQAGAWNVSNPPTPDITQLPIKVLATQVVVGINVSNPPTPDQTQVPLKALATQVVVGINVLNPPTPNQTIVPASVQATQIAIHSNAGVAQATAIATVYVSSQQALTPQIPQATQQAIAASIATPIATLYFDANQQLTPVWNLSNHSVTENTGAIAYAATPTIRTMGLCGSDTLFSSATRSASVTTADFTNLGGRGCNVVEATTTVTGSGIFTVAIDGKDSTTGGYYNIITSANISAATTNVYRVYPGVTAAANATVNDVLPTTYRCRLTLISGTSQVNLVGIAYIP